MPMTDAPAAKRTRAQALDATVSTVIIVGMGRHSSLFVQSDGTRLVSTFEHTILAISRSGRPSLIAGSKGKKRTNDGDGTSAQFAMPCGLTVDKAGNIVVAGFKDHAIRTVSLAGQVYTLAGNRQAGFADGQGEAARFRGPVSVVLGANGELLVLDSDNHAIRAVSSAGAVRTLAGNGEEGFVDGQGGAARFNDPLGLALDVDGSLLMADSGNHAIRRVTMAGEVSTVAGNGEEGFADGAGAAARLKREHGGGRHQRAWWWTARAPSWW